MATAQKVLGQNAPAATTPVNLYTVPALKYAVVSTIVVCNRGGTATTFRLSVAVAGAGADVKQHLYYDVSISANDTFAATIGITLATTDVVVIYAGNTNLSFNLFGTEGDV